MPARNDGVNCDFCARSRECPACDGTGRESDDALCETCHGNGHVLGDVCVPCGGRGRVDSPTVCQTCKGKKTCQACSGGQRARPVAGEPGWVAEPLPNVPLVQPKMPGVPVPAAAVAAPDVPAAKGSFDDGDE